MNPDTKAATTALLILSQHGIPVDVQELLIYGNPRLGIAPGALSKVVKAIVESYKAEQ